MHKPPGISGVQKEHSVWELQKTLCCGMWSLNQAESSRSVPRQLLSWVKSPYSPVDDSARPIPATRLCISHHSTAKDFASGKIRPISWREQQTVVWEFGCAMV